MLNLLPSTDTPNYLKHPGSTLIHKYIHHTEIPNPGIAALTGLVDKTKLVRFESAAVSALHALPFSVNPGGATGL